MYRFYLLNIDLDFCFGGYFLSFLGVDCECGIVVVMFVFFFWIVGVEGIFRYFVLCGWVVGIDCDIFWLCECIGVVGSLRI